MLRSQQGPKSEQSDARPRAGPSGLYSFQNDALAPAMWGLPCLQDSRTCSLGWLLLLGCTTAFLLFEIASRPLPVKHWSGACGKACRQLQRAQVIADSCHPPLVDEERLHYANEMFDDTCYVLPKTCLDQGFVVVFDDKYKPEEPDHETVPAIEMSNIMYNFPSSHGNGDALGADVTRIPFPDIIIRPGTNLDTHLSSHTFSRCTVPVVMITNWVTTYGEAIVRVPQRAFAWKANNAIGDNVTYVIATPGGMALPAFYGPMLAPVTPLAVQSLADFSDRQPQGTASGATNEGLSHQCFDRVVLCKIAVAQFRNMFEVGQATYAHYAQEGLPQNPAGFPSASQDRTKALGIASFLSKPSTEEAHPPEQLRVLIEQRSGETRNMLQLDELLRQCNDSQDQESAYRFACRPFIFTSDLKRNIAAVRSANVLVTIHGSGSNNALFMEEGSILIDIRPFEFGTKASAWANAFMPQITEQNGYKIRYIGLNIEDEALSEPGSFEASGIGNPDEDTHRRDRHVKLPWEILERMLRLVRECETLEDYKRLVSEGMHILNVLPGGVLEGWSGNPEVPAAVVSASEVYKIPWEGSVITPPKAVRNSSAADMPG